MVDPSIRPAWPGAQGLRPCGHRRVPARRQPDAARRRGERAAPASSSSRPSAGYLSAGAWGEILTEAAQARGVAGLVIDGAVRDIDAIERERVSRCSAAAWRSASCTKEQAGQLDVPIQLGGATVVPGDLIFGNADGVVVIEQDRIDAVYEAAVSRRERESEIIGEAARGPDDDRAAGADRSTSDDWRWLAAAAGREAEPNSEETA